MGLNLNNLPKPSGQGTYQRTVLEAGAYPARVVSVIDLGLQTNRFDDKIKPQIQVTYELVTEFLLDENGNEVEDKPRWVSEFLNLCHPSNEKSKLVMRMKAIDPKGATGFDVAQLIGLPCVVTLTKEKKKTKDEEYNKVSNVISPMKGYEVPALVNEPRLFLLDNPDMAVFTALPDFLKEMIASNVEFAGSALAKALGSTNSAPEQPQQQEQQEEPTDNEPTKAPWE